MVDNCDLLLRAAELLDHSKQTPQMKFTPSRRDDFAVPDMDASSPMYATDDSGAEDGTEETAGTKRTRLASLKVSRFTARDAIAHNSVEKRRRAYLASCYDNLKCSIPTLAGTRASNVKVLRGGLALIKTLEAEDRRLVAEKKRLLAQRDTLMQQNNLLAKQLFRKTAERAVPSYPVMVAAPVLLAPVAPVVAAPTSASMLMDNEEVAMSLMLLAEMRP